MKLLGALVLSLVSTISFADPTPGDKPWLFFDIGNTLLKHLPNRKLEYFPNTLSNIKKLRDNNVRLGIISNIPPSWGATHQKRLEKLKRFIANGLPAGSEPFPEGANRRSQ